MKCPADVPPEVAAEFERIVGLMGERAVEADCLTVLMLAHSWTTWRKAIADVHKLGTVVMSGGTAIPNPSLGVAHQAHMQIVTLCKELGLTAASRKKVAPQAFEDDPEWR
jgi:P27 family predicted phage terminase small subunit